MSKPKRTDFQHPSTLLERLKLRHDQCATAATGGHISIYSEAADRIEELQKKLEAVRPYMNHKVGCKWNSKPVAKLNMFEVIRQPCSCGLHTAIGEDKS